MEGLMPGATLIFLRLPLFLLGLIVYFVGQRYFSAHEFVKYLLIASYALMGLGLVAGWIASLQSAAKGFAARAACLRLASLWQVAVLVAVGLNHLYLLRIADKGSPDDLGTKMLLGSWLLLLIIGLFAGVGSELSLLQAGLGRFAEPKRIRRGAGGWMMVGMLLASIVALNFAGVKYNVAKDWSYLKVTQPSEATQNYLRTLKDEISVVMFFEKNSEVLPYVREYFDNIARLEPKIKVQWLDKDMEPVLAETLKVRRNGIVHLLKGTELVKDAPSESLNIGTKLTSAREKISKLDQEFHSAMLKLLQDRQTAYFVSGHGELSWKGAESDPNRQIKRIQSFLISQNYRVKDLDHDQGLSRGVPADATVVFLMAPKSPFLDAELEALADFVDKGGSLFVALDIKEAEAPQGLQSEVTVHDQLNTFLSARGLVYQGQPLANEQASVPVRRNPSDVWFTYTQSYSSHESVTYLSKVDEKTPFLVDGSGSITLAPSVESGWKSVETVRSKPGTFEDANRNFAFDEQGGEKRQVFNLAAVSEKKREGEKAGRIALLADASALSDFIVSISPANQVFFVEALNWLRGTPELAGRPQSEEDIKIKHTKNEDMAIFYSTILGMPAFVLLLGFLATRRKSRRRKIGNEVDSHAA